MDFFDGFEIINKQDFAKVEEVKQEQVHEVKNEQINNIQNEESEFNKAIEEHKAPKSIILDDALSAQKEGMKELKDEFEIISEEEIRETKAEIERERSEILKEWGVSEAEMQKAYVDQLKETEAIKNYINGIIDYHDDDFRPVFDLVKSKSLKIDSKKLCGGLEIKGVSMAEQDKLKEKYKKVPEAAGDYMTASIIDIHDNYSQFKEYYYKIALDLLEKICKDKPSLKKDVKERFINRMDILSILNYVDVRDTNSLGDDKKALMDENKKIMESFLEYVVAEEEVSQKDVSDKKDSVEKAKNFKPYCKKYLNKLVNMKIKLNGNPLDSYDQAAEHYADRLGDFYLQSTYGASFEYIFGQGASKTHIIEELGYERNFITFLEKVYSEPIDAFYFDVIKEQYGRFAVDGFGTLIKELNGNIGEDFNEYVRMKNNINYFTMEEAFKPDKRWGRTVIRTKEFCQKGSFIGRIWENIISGDKEIDLDELYKEYLDPKNKEEIIEFFKTNQINYQAD